MTSPPGFVAAVRLLLRAARQRERARLKARSKHATVNPRSLFALVVGAMLLLHVVMGVLFVMQTRAFSVAADERSGTLSISKDLYGAIARAEAARTAGSLQQLGEARDALDDAYAREARAFERARGGERAEWRAELARRVDERGVAAFSVKQGAFDVASAGFPVLTLLLVLWWLSLALQGETLGFDATRRRHPMWEWLLRFPVPPATVFVAEALAPLAANPMLLTAPILFAVVAGSAAQSWLAGLAAVPVAVPLVVAAAIWGKTVEVVVMLRSRPRNRGIWLAVFSGVGFLALAAPFAITASPAALHRVAAAALPWIETLPAPTMLFSTDSIVGWLAAMATSLAIGAALAVPALLLLRSATSRGLEDGFGNEGESRSSDAFSKRDGWLRDPLRRKDWLWLTRDHGALFQLVAVPLALAALQFVNLQRILERMAMNWHSLAGIVVGVGAYLLFIAGPRALASEGPALVLTLSWPRSLEDTLRTKVHLLFALVSAMVYLCLVVLVWMFPRDALGIVLVAAAWPLFGLPVAEKAVTLVQAPNQSGVIEPPPPARVFMTGIGNLAFAIGVFNAQWHVAVAAIALNWVFAGALWQSFRHRLAYLFDPESEPVLRPPTILSSVLAIVGLLELGLVIAVPTLLFVGKDGAMFAQAFGYGVAAIIVVIAVGVWHRKFDVGLYDLLALDERANRAPAGYCLAAIAIGALLALVAFGYQQLLFELPLPAVHEALEKSRAFLRESPNAALMLTVLAVGFAPWIEELLFRGLMFRAMLGQWNFAHATLASSAFFAILHAPPFWPMIFALGAACALVYHRSRALLPCILLHFTYNGLVVALR